MKRSRNFKSNSCNLKNIVTTKESKEADTNIDNRRYDRINKSITKLIKMDRILQSTMRFSIYDDSNVLCLPKISAYSIKASCHNNCIEYSANLNKLKDQESGNECQYTLNNLVKPPVKSFIKVKNKSENKCKLKKYSENVKDLMKTKFSMPDEILKEDQNFKHLFIIKENKKGNKN